MSEYKFHQMPKPPDIKPKGKLRLVNFPGTPEKLFVDTRGQLFEFIYYPKQIIFLGNVTWTK